MSGAQLALHEILVERLDLGERLKNILSTQSFGRQTVALESAVWWCFLTPELTPPKAMTVVTLMPSSFEKMNTLIYFGVRPDFLEPTAC